ncbi:transcriptional regulator [Streptomyces sp. NPDC006798]|uniref:tetratricopeptide repeat protein n=1 Tax=Streptomyces sp. NPDC006798 TaxID=3155462 RepID=UPI0033C9FF7F
MENCERLGPENLFPQRRLFMGVGLFSVAVGIPNWLDVAGRMEAVQSRTVSRIGMPDVDMVKKMTDQFEELYGQFGGRRSRPMAARFLANTVVPYLHADAFDGVRKAMLSAASLLSYLTGWMAVDEGLHGLAREYYAKGLELASAGADHLTYCRVLRGMSVQAADLGHGEIAVRLANAAAATSAEAGPRMSAFMAGQQAHSFAVAGEKSSALRSIMETERAVDVAESGSGSFGGYGPATLAYHAAQVRYALGDVSGSIESLKLYFQLRGPSETQVSGIRFQLMLAERQLELGHLEAACATWSEVLDKYPAMHSGRVDRRVRAISRLLLPYTSNGLARDISERSRHLSRAA